MLGFLRFGYSARRHFWDDPEIDVDLSGRVMLVTGANAGLGFATTRALLRRSATVIAVCRNPRKAADAMAELAREVPGGTLRLELCDISDLDDVARLCERLSTERRLDTLIHNAGVLLDERRTTPQGFELTWATNVLGPHLMTHRLLPVLGRTPGARIVQVTSGGMYTQKLALDDLEYEKAPFDGVVQYARTKRAQVILNALWAKRLAPSITSNAMHPGWAATPGVASSLPRFDALLRPLLRTPEQGADTIVWLAAAEKPAHHTGELWFDRRSRRIHLLPGTRSTNAEHAALFARCDAQVSPWLG